MKNVIVKLLPCGSITVDAQGYAGSACELATAFLKHLGAVENDVKKSEYFETLNLTEEVKIDG